MVVGESVVEQDANLVQYLQKFVQIVKMQVVTNTVDPVYIANGWKIFFSR